MGLFSSPRISLVAWLGAAIRWRRAIPRSSIPQGASLHQGWTDRRLADPVGLPQRGRIAPSRAAQRGLPIPPTHKPRASFGLLSPALQQLFHGIPLKLLPGLRIFITNILGHFGRFGMLRVIAIEGVG